MKKRRECRPIDEVEEDVENMWARVDELLLAINKKAKAVNEALDREKETKNDGQDVFD